MGPPSRSKQCKELIEKAALRCVTIKRRPRINYPKSVPVKKKELLKQGIWDVNGRIVLIMGMELGGF